MSPTRESYLFTSESVTEGHPDKIADQISDAVLDAHLEQDPSCRVACETSVSTGMVLLTGEITSDADVDHNQVVRDVIRDIGYTSSELGFDAETCSVMVALDEQSEDIAQGVNPGGAGDQGLMFGYANTETEEYMPAPIMLSHRLTKGLAELRKNGEIDYLRPDGKSQVTIRYENDQPVEVDTAVVSTQHDPDVSQDRIKEDVIEALIRDRIPDDLITDDTEYLVNPTGRFVRGGPYGDAGLTGRKIIVDTYGGTCSHGGGAFSGKDSTKVDRSATYGARYVAKNMVAAGFAEKCTVQLAYAIGVEDPVSILVDAHGTSDYSPSELQEAARETFELSPNGLIESLGLREPIFQPTAAYGHFGRQSDSSFTWEKTDKVDVLKETLSSSTTPVA
ncbi:MAG: methionine adenosyltransferase [bacterium]